MNGQDGGSIQPGHIYWLALAAPGGTGEGIPHPHAVVEVDTLNHCVLACALTSNRERASIPGNVLLEAGEANLPRPSVVEVGKSVTVDVARLGEYVGRLSEERVGQIRAGMRFQQSFLSRTLP